MAIYGVDKNWITDLFIGIGAAITFIFLGKIFPMLGTIGIPSISQSIAGEAGRFILIVIVAAIAEEFFFREFLQDFFDEKLKAFGLDLPYFIAALISSALFALFHFTAYSGSLSAAGGSFLSAAIVGFGFCYIRKWTKSNIGNIMAHAVLNFWILTKLAIVIGG